MRSFAYVLIAAAVATSAITIPSPQFETRAVASLPVNGKFDYQLGVAYTPPAGTTVLTRDRTASTVSGLYNICYINAFQTQPDSDSRDWWIKNHKDLLLTDSNGNYFEDPDWAGEIFLDTRTSAKQQAIASILNGWIDDCKKKGFNAIEPDNLDTYSRSNGLLSKSNNLALSKLIADHAHSLGLAIAQKNSADLGSSGKSTAGFDFCVVEECQAYNECDSYTSVYGNQMLEIEYTDSKSASSNFQKACSARGSSIAIVFRDRQLVGPSQGGYHYEQC